MNVYYLPFPLLFFICKLQWKKMTPIMTPSKITHANLEGKVAIGSCSQPAGHLTGVLIHGTAWFRLSKWMANFGPMKVNEM